MDRLSGYTWASKQALKNIEILSHKKKEYSNLEASPTTHKANGIGQST